MTDPLTWPLVDAEHLAARLDASDLRIFDCRFSLADPEAGRRAFAEGHLPGATYAHLDEHLSSPITPSSGRHPLPDPSALTAWLGACGVGNDSEVVVYDDLGGAFAVRLWWLLRWLGHPRVAVLDGGLQAWRAAGGEIRTDTSAPAPTNFDGSPDDAQWLTTAALTENLSRGENLVVDARAPERFRGELEPIDPVAGHIPGAINLPLTGNLDAAGRFLSPEVLRRRFLNALGGRAAERIVHSCGSGVNACHNLLAMELAGLPGSRLYAGSWSEWIRDPARPVQLGA
jgi:thiosulfate/3-mercaptopyruvate sulfurtransferase